MTYSGTNIASIKQQDFNGNLLNTTTATWMTGGIYSSGMTFSNLSIESGPVGQTGVFNLTDHLQSVTVTDPVTGHTNTKTLTYDARGNLQQSTVTGTNPHGANDDLHSARHLRQTDASSGPKGQRNKIWLCRQLV